MNEPRGCWAYNLAVVWIFHLTIDCGWTIKLRVIECIERLGTYVQ